MEVKSEEVRKGRRMEVAKRPGRKVTGLPMGEPLLTDGTGWDHRLGEAVRRASSFLFERTVII